MISRTYIDKRTNSCYSVAVFVKLHSRRSLDSFSRPTPTPRPPSPKSHGINVFADPHPLTPVASILYKNIGGQGSSTFQSPSPISYPPHSTLAIPFLFNYLRIAHFASSFFSWSSI